MHWCSCRFVFAVSFVCAVDVAVVGDAVVVVVDAVAVVVVVVVVVVAVVVVDVVVVIAVVGGWVVVLFGLCPVCSRFRDPGGNITNSPNKVGVIRHCI